MIPCLEGRNPRKGIETFFISSISRERIWVRKDVILERGLKLYSLRLFNLLFNGPEGRNPRKGIETIPSSFVPVEFI